MVPILNSNIQTLDDHYNNVVSFLLQKRWILQGVLNKVGSQYQNLNKCLRTVLKSDATMLIQFDDTVSVKSKLNSPLSLRNNGYIGFMIWRWMCSSYTGLSAGVCSYSAGHSSGAMIS